MGWYSPSGTLGHTYENVRSTDSSGCSWSSISSQRLWEHDSGEWSVKFFYDNTLYHTANFVFEDPGEFEYLVYQPDSFVPGNGILIAVHGDRHLSALFTCNFQVLNISFDPDVALAVAYGLHRKELRDIERLMRENVELLRNEWDAFCLVGQERFDEYHNSRII